MNCLFLLIILLFCNGNSGCNSNCSRMGNNSRIGRNCMENHNGSNCTLRESNSNRSTGRGCDCDSSQVNSCPVTPPPVPRTQFPYLDMEPRTCGCEEEIVK